MSEYKPHAVIIAGPNGSGKTSLIDDLIAFGYQKRPPLTLPSHIINPDKIRQSPEILALKATSQNLDLAAQKLAYQRRQRLIEARQSLAFETVMSHPSRLVELQQLRDQGYRVFLTFITTNNADINVERVRYRVQTGTTTGHDVPERSITERHVRTLNLLPAAIELADVSLLYDNSYDRQSRIRLTKPPAAYARHSI